MVQIMSHTTAMFVNNLPSDGSNLSSSLDSYCEICQLFLACVQADAGLESLDIAMKSGFDQFNKIRNDPNLEQLRASKKFKTLMDQYDEPVIDTNIFK